MSITGMDGITQIDAYEKSRENVRFAFGVVSSITGASIDVDAGMAQYEREIAEAVAKDPVALPCTLEGPRARAWICDSAAMRRSVGASTDEDSTLAQWVVEVPWANKAWHSYSVALIHLRPLPMLRQEPLIYLDGATHEMWVHALDPEGKRQIMIEGNQPGRNGAPHFLTPKNFAAQFIEITDQLAYDRVRNSVNEICHGALSPDTDFRWQWIERYGDNMMKNANDEARKRGTHVRWMQ